MKKFMREWGSYIIIIIVVLLIKMYIVSPVIVKGESMEDNFYDGELLILSKISYRLDYIHRFDVVVIDDGDDLIIKRVIGLPGENVEYKDNKLYINDELVSDIYQKDSTLDFDLEDICDVKGDRCVSIIPDDKYLVLGDNRSVSADSRSKGLIDRDKIMGKIILRLYPFNRIGIIGK